MARTVFILGAGASLHAGAPLMVNFYSSIINLLESGKTGNYTEDFELVREGNNQLDNVYAKVKMGYHDNIEDLFATFEMGNILGHLGNLQETKVNNLIKSMKRVICATIESSMKYKYIKGKGIQPHIGYLEFADCVKKLKETHHKDIAIISFNYDYALEYAFKFVNIDLNYCLSDTDSEIIPYLKLHGSLNWGICETCKEIIPYTMNQWIFKPKFPIEFDQDIKDKSFNISEHINELEHCSKNLISEPFIVPPTWNKTNYSKSISKVWKRAAKELSNARSIFIIGYSLPKTDEFFRHLIALSLAGGPLIDIFAIVNPDKRVYDTINDWVGEKLKRPLKYIDSTFEESKNKILNALS